MKANRRFRSLDSDTEAAVGTYVLILFGLVIVLYMFGFTNTLNSYLSTANVEGGNITNSSLIENQDTNPIMMFMKALINFFTKNGFAFAAGIGGLAITFIVGTFFKIDLSVIYNYIIPIAILAVVLNILVFPVSSLDAELRDMVIWAIPVSWIVIAFFNIMFILAVLEYVSGRP